MTGHVFVVQGNALQIACDELLVPTDRFGNVVEPWLLALGTPTLPDGWEADTVRFTKSEIAKGKRIRWVNSGAPQQMPDRRRWLCKGVRSAMTASAAELVEQAPAAGPEFPVVPAHGRSRPLIAAPLFGTGAGGFRGVRGAVIRDLLDISREVVTMYDVDVVLVAFTRSDYAALQSQRQDESNFPLEGKLLEAANSLGRKMADGEVAFFIGAGLSLAAGLPTWRALIRKLAEGSEKYRNKVQQLLKIPAVDAAQLLSEEKDFRVRLGDALQSSSHAVGHALIASMRPAEVITTNFDTLYEQAAMPTYDEHLVVIPTERGPARTPWLLKLHGDIGGDHIVLNRDEFLQYDTLWRPLAGMLQAAMLTRHLVFVGYSLEDENFIRLGRSVGALLRSMGHTDPVGTILTLDRRPMRKALWGHDLSEVSTIVRGKNAAWMLEVFLDRMAAVAAGGESSYLLDEAYADLLDAPDKALAEEMQCAGKRLADLSQQNAKWSELRRAFASLGLNIPPK